MTLYNRFRDGTQAALVATWQGTEIETGFNHTIKLTLASARFDGKTPKVSGPDIIEQPLSFMATEPATGEALTLLYRTTDTAS